MLGFKVFSLIEVKTVNMQVSGSIEASKKNKIFIAEYKPFFDDPAIKGFIIGETWTENAWKYEIKNWQKIIKIFPETKIVIKIDDFGELNLDETEYLIKWDVEEGDGHHRGSGSGGFHLIYMGQSYPPDTLSINIRKRLSFKDDYGTFYTFYLIKKR